MNGKQQGEIWRRKLNFTVDAALLAELGERLVGQPYIALAELVKNAYDADAHRVTIEINPKEDRIIVADNGHGMSADEFKRFWMRIGSSHKVDQRFSRGLKRPMTGSKGVGRLAVQFLARKIELITVSKTDSKNELRATVDWDRAVKAGELTSAEANVQYHLRQTSFPEDRKHGTQIVLSNLNQEWGKDELKGLASEIWRLQSPFASAHDTSDDKNRFVIDFRHPSPEEEAEFRLLLSAIRDIWHARIQGRLVREVKNNRVNSFSEIVLEFADGKRIKQKYEVKGAFIYKASFDIRIYHLQHRQPYGIRVQDARDYLNQFGGVGIYDAGFRLPYYGPEQDWIGVEFDHAHRIHLSKLLPEELQVERGLQFLPTNSRLLGVVKVDTAFEREQAEKEKKKRYDNLTIQVSRDRLSDNAAYKCLRDMVRWALDYYAMQEAARQAEVKAAEPETHPTVKIQRVGQILDRYQDAIPKPIRHEITQHIEEAISASEAETEQSLRRLNSMATLATAGISAIAYEHEINRQFHTLEHLIKRLKHISKDNPEIADLTNGVTEWLERARGTRALFSPFMDAENREKRQRFRAKALVDEVKRQMAPLLRGVAIDNSRVDPSLRLPTGTFVEWSAIFQNIILNAVNALADAEVKKISIISDHKGKKQYLTIQDTGIGVDLEEAEKLFEPFQRRLNVSQSRRELGLGGTGLGLTIVRMLSENLGCNVSFVEPSEGYHTGLSLTWSEQ